MKKYLPLLLLFASTTMVACAQTRKTTTVVATQKEQPAAKSYGFDYVLIDRGACYGRCPIYSIKVFPDGLLQYYGKRFVTKEGLFEKRLSPNEVAPVFENMQTYRIDTTKDNYNVPIADLPTLTIAYSYKGQKRKIINAQFGPGLFRVLAKQIDNLAQVDDSWTKTGHANPE